MTMPPLMPFLEARSSAPGVSVTEVDLVAAAGSGFPFRAARFRVEAGCRSRRDAHAAHECWMIAAGEGSLFFDDARLHLRCGAVLYFPPFTVHQAENDSSEPLEIFSVWWTSPA